MLFNEPKLLKFALRPRTRVRLSSFSALQRAEIAEIVPSHVSHVDSILVSVLFNEPKLLKSEKVAGEGEERGSFSALQRAEIAEIEDEQSEQFVDRVFQCSSTSRNC